MNDPKLESNISRGSSESPMQPIARLPNAGSEGFAHFRSQRKIFIVEIGDRVELGGPPVRWKLHIPAIQDVLRFGLLHEMRLQPCNRYPLP